MSRARPTLAIGCLLTTTGVLGSGTTVAAPPAHCGASRWGWVLREDRTLEDQNPAAGGATVLRYI
jgi:hypothetical protein